MAGRILTDKMRSAYNSPSAKIRARRRQLSGQRVAFFHLDELLIVNDNLALPTRARSDQISS